MPFPEDLIGYDWGDDADISDMCGVYDEDFGARDAEGMMIINKADIPREHLKQPPKWLEKPGKVPDWCSALQGTAHGSPYKKF